MVDEDSRKELFPILASKLYENESRPFKESKHFEHSRSLNRLELPSIAQTLSPRERTKFNDDIATHLVVKKEEIAHKLMPMTKPRKFHF
jgi:hypothetical protein